MNSEIEKGVNRERLRGAIASELKSYNASLERDSAYQYFDSVVLHFM